MYFTCRPNSHDVYHVIHFDFFKASQRAAKCQFNGSILLVYGAPVQLLQRTHAQDASNLDRAHFPCNLDEAESLASFSSAQWLFSEFPPQ